MIKTISHVTEDQSTLLKSKISQIAKETNAEMILCFGIRTSHVFIWSSFLQASDEVRSMECDLVLLTKEQDKAKRDELLESVLKHNNAALKFTVLVHGIETIAAKLKEGHHFFSSLLQKGEVLFESQVFSLTVTGSVPLAVSNIEAYWTKSQPLFSRCYPCVVGGLE